MALPLPLQASTTPYELEFIAAEEIVEIVPLIAMERIRLLSGVYGPFRPPAKTRVPLWMAVNLKTRFKCHIVPPEWLSVEYLQDRLNEEISSETFSVLPFRYAEIAKALLESAPDNITSPDKITLLLKDIREARQAKSREGLKMVDHVQLRIRNICSMEINEIRPFFIKSMGVLTKLQPPPGEEVADPNETFDSSTFFQSSADDTLMDSEW